MGNNIEKYVDRLTIRLTDRKESAELSAVRFADSQDYTNAALKQKEAETFEWALYVSLGLLRDMQTEESIFTAVPPSASESEVQ